MSGDAEALSAATLMVGVLGEMCIRDSPWFERPIFGQIRYMSGASTGKKFDSKKYIQQNLSP